MRQAEKTQTQIQVIARAGAILRALENESAGLSLGQIAQRVHLARSTVQRIVAALAAEKLVIAASVHTDFAALVRPFLVQLSHELHETVDLATVKHDHLVFIDQVIGSQRLRTVSAVGESFPLSCTANGKAYLAELDDREIERLIGRRFEARTANTLTTLTALLADLKAARRTGVALDREEHTVGISAAGVALRDLAGNYVAISVPVPTSRFKERQARIAARLLATKRAIESHMSVAEAAE